MTNRATGNQVRFSPPGTALDVIYRALADARARDFRPADQYVIRMHPMLWNRIRTDASVMELSAFSFGRPDFPDRLFGVAVSLDESVRPTFVQVGLHLPIPALA